MNLNMIAKLAGVSKSTASRALSNSGSVSKKSYDKVMAVAKKYNYAPNQYARIINNKSSHLIGVIAPDIKNPYFPEIIECITEIASDRGYRILLCNYDTKRKTEIEYLNILKSLRADGTILLCPTAELTNLDAYSSMAIVSIDSIVNERIPYVISDFYKGGFIAGSKLLDNGCKNILHISGSKNYYANVQRAAGFAASMQKKSDAGIHVFTLDDVSNSKSYEKIKLFIEEHRQIDGIFTDNDSIAFTVLRILQELHISVPQKVKLIGYDDNFMIPMVYPLLSTIHQPISDVGKTAVNTLISLINGQQISMHNILDVSYIKRDTTVC